MHLVALLVGGTVVVARQDPAMNVYVEVASWTDATGTTLGDSSASATLALLDANSDGGVDVLVGGANPVLLLSSANGTALVPHGSITAALRAVAANSTTTGTTTGLTSASPGDVTCDGVLDVVVTRGTDLVVLALARGDVSEVPARVIVLFSDPTANLALGGSAIGDVDNDGVVDVVACGPSGAVLVALGGACGGVASGSFNAYWTGVVDDGSGTVFPRVSCTGVSLGDTDGDGDLDASVGLSDGVGHLLLLNMGDGTFALPASASAPIPQLSAVMVAS